MKNQNIADHGDNSQRDRLLRRPEVEKLIGRGRSAIYQMVAAGTFPAPVKIGDRAVGWSEIAVKKWISKISNQKTVQSERILRRPEVEKLIGRGCSAIYQMVAAGTFPAPVKIGDRAVGWPESVVNQWIDERIKKGGIAL